MSQCNNFPALSRFQLTVIRSGRGNNNGLDDLTFTLAFYSFDMSIKIILLGPELAYIYYIQKLNDKYPLQ